MKRYKFRARIEAGDGGGAYVLFPFNVEKEFGVKGKVPVRATFNGVAYTGSLIKYGNPLHMLPVLKAIREQTRTAPGDTVEIELWRDEAPRVVEPPALFKKAMVREGVVQTFEGLSYTHRKEYCRWIAEAKKEETQLKRVVQAIEMLRKKVKTPAQRASRTGGGQFGSGEKSRRKSMIKLSVCVLCGALSLYLAVSAGTKVFAAGSVAPVRMDRDKMAGLGLTSIPPDAYKDILVTGELNMRVATLFEGKELRAEIFESTPAKTNHRARPTDGDEFVYVLSGKLILTEPNGTVQEFRPGDSLVLPLGYTGTWEMQGNYRELAVVMQKRK